jgi:hypothetical protein
VELKMKIEKNVNPPNQVGRKKYPFGEMEVGDSIFIASESSGGRSNPAFAARCFRREKGWRFTARKENDGVRIWRIS